MYMHRWAVSLLSLGYDFAPCKLSYVTGCLRFASCRWLQVFRPEWQSSCRQRSALLLAELYSGWAVAAIFLSLVPTPCEARENPSTFLVAALIAWLSSIFGLLPLQLLIAVARGTRQKRMLFWAFVGGYVVICVAWLALRTDFWTQL